MKLNSYTITQGPDRAPARAMLKAIGFTDEDLAKPIIGVANTWIETMPCNYNLRDLAVKVYDQEGLSRQRAAWAVRTVPASILPFPAASAGPRAPPA